MTVPPALSRLLAAVLAVMLMTGCSLLGAHSGSGPSSSDAGSVDRYPDVLAVELRPRGERRYDVTVTLSSPYDNPQRYADGWRVLDPSGVELGVHDLLHDHAAEQPFTRTQFDLLIPVGIEQVTVEGRDLVYGFGGRTLTVEVPA